VQWMRSISGVVSSAFLYVWYFVNILFHFRPYQLMGLRRKLILICGLFYCLETLYRIVLQALKIPYSKFSTLLKIPLNTMFFYQFMLSSLSFNESFSNATNKKTAGGLFPTNDTPRLFLFHSRYDVSVFHLPHVQPTAQGRQTVNRNPGSSHWRRTFANFRSAVMEHHSSGLFLGLISPAVFLLSGYVSSITGDLNNIRSIAFLGLIHGVAEVID